MTIGRIAIVVMVGVVVAGADVAHAQQPAAESLFREGKQLFEDGDFAAACKKFQASEELEPSVGTELNLANCREKNGQTATAWAVFLKAATNAKAKKDTKRAAEAKRRAKLLEAKLVYLTIKVSARAPDLAITRNDVAVGEAEWDQRLPIDPGDYTIDVKAPGHVAWSKHITIDDKNKTIEVPALDEEPIAEEPKPKKKRGKKKSPPPPTDAPHRKYAGAAYTFGVIGVAGLGAGIGFGLHARSLSNQADDRCPNAACLDPGALDANDRARSAARIANIGFAAGGAALATAVILFVVGRPAKTEQVSLVPIVGSHSVGFAIGVRL